MDNLTSRFGLNGACRHALSRLGTPSNSPLKKYHLRRQRKNPNRLCMSNTLRALAFFFSLHLALFERTENLDFF